MNTVHMKPVKLKSAVELRPIPKNDVSRILAAIDIAVRQSNRAASIARIGWVGGSFGPLSLAAMKEINRGHPMRLPILEQPEMSILIVD